MYDSVLMIGFGGPERREDAAPFLDRVLAGRKIPQAERDRILGRYEAAGGASPYNRQVRELAGRLTERLREKGAGLPVFFGMRNWHPFLEESFERMAAGGFGKCIGIVLSPFRSPASYGRYVEHAERAARQNGAAVEFVAPWHSDPLFIRAQAGCLRENISERRPAEKETTAVLFTAHSIPVSAARGCFYARDIGLAAREIMKEFPGWRWQVAYQSRGAGSEEVWLGPAIAETVRRLGASGIRRIVAVPAGFLFENLEISYDLDIEARAEAARAGMVFDRVRTVSACGAFVELLASRVLEKAGGLPS